MMKAWIQQNLLALVVTLASATGVYASMASQQAVARAEISALQRTVILHEEVLAEIPAIKRDILYVSLEISELKPIMTGLNESINNLNVSLAKLEGKLEKVTNGN